MSKKLPVEGSPGLYRDTSSNAIIDCSDVNFDRYLQLKDQKLHEINEINKIKNQVDQIENIKSEMAEMKDMMKIILSKL